MSVRGYTSGFANVSVLIFFTGFPFGNSQPQPAWNKVADLFADEPNVKIVSVNADEHKSLGQEYEVQGIVLSLLFSRLCSTISGSWTVFF